jgi:hypothetical protein
MKRLAATLALVALAGPAFARERAPQSNYANPSAVIAAEIAFAQLAQDKGQWTAFRATATRDAVMFAPQMVYAQEFLGGKADPAKSVTWQPHQVWSSCDGSIGVTRGAWQRGELTGFFTTIWQRQKDGAYKWIMDQGDELPMALDPPEMIVAKVADCPKGPRGKPGKLPKLPKKLPPLDSGHAVGQSLDGTLNWEVTVQPDGARNLSVSMVTGGAMTPVQVVEFAAPPAR